MSNVSVLEKYREKRQKLWNEKHELETRYIQVYDSILKEEYDAFICPIGNYKETVCLNNEDEFQMITYNKFNLSRFTILNSEELLNII
jgi:hypothetical protein